MESNDVRLWGTPQGAEPRERSSVADRRRSNRSTVERYLATLQAFDEEAWIALHAPGAVTLDSSGGPPVAGREGHRDLFRGLFGSFDRLWVDEQRIWTAPDGAAVRWTARATGRDGREYVFEAVDVFEMDEDGRVRTLRRFWDPAG